MLSAINFPAQPALSTLSYWCPMSPRKKKTAKEKPKPYKVDARAQKYLQFLVRTIMEKTKELSLVVGRQVMIHKDALVGLDLAVGPYRVKDVKLDEDLVWLMLETPSNTVVASHAVDFLPE